MEINVNRQQFAPISVFWTGGYFHIGRVTDNVVHTHHAIQISIGIEGGFTVSTEESELRSHGLLIGPDVPHCVNGGENQLGTLMIDAETTPAKLLVEKYLKGKTTHVLGKRVVTSVLASIPKFIRYHGIQDCYQASEVIKYILGKLVDSSSENQRSVDSRIPAVLDFINNLEIKKVSTKTIARQVYLSETRLIHLFKNEIGIPIRRYLLWSRIQDAMKLMSKGTPITEAAYQAGFSDSAHLTRSVKKTYGVPPSVVFKKSQNKIFPCLAEDNVFMSAGEEC